MKASESARLRAESALREELEGRWRQLQELDTERVRALQGQCQVGVGWTEWAQNLKIGLFNVFIDSGSYCH